jgi:hypothetical protein
MCIKNHTHYSVESVMERVEVVPSLSSVCGRARQVVETWTVHVSDQGLEERGHLHDGLKMLQWNLHCSLYNMQHEKGCSETRVVLRKWLSSTLPWSLLWPSPVPPRKKSTTYPKLSPHKISHHQCADPGIDSMDSPHPWTQEHRTHSKDSHPKPGSERVPAPSGTRISSPLECRVTNLLLSVNKKTNYYH